MRAIDKTYAAGDFYEDFKNRAWAQMCSYTHNGLLQLGRRFTAQDVKPAYTDEEIFEATTTATTCVLFLVVGFLAIRRYKEDSEAAKALIESYSLALAKSPAGRWREERDKEV